MQKLKTVSGESVADLDEATDADYLGSAREASQRYQAQLKKILGEEKMAQLAQLVAKRYAGSDDIQGLLPSQPNAVPTDTRIVVNAPAYRMDVFQDGKLTKTYRVGIGYPEFPLPVGMRRADQIIFNPTWTPPNEPWVKGKFKPGQKVEAGSKDNPLGPLKIPIGSPNLIHGGKQPAKLGGFASHGCVGLTNEGVQDFAATLSALSGSAMTVDSVSGFRDKKTQTKTVKLAKPIPVELRYETMVAEAGGLRVYRDVYERGTNNMENLKRVLNVYGVSYDALPQPEKDSLIAALMEMNRDPQGNAILADIGSGTTGNDTGKRDDPTKSDKAKQGKTTNTVKGRKDVLVAIAALQGKGYPAPVNVVGAPPPPAAPKAAAPATRKRGK